jgi:hypothetical protein
MHKDHILAIFLSFLVFILSSSYYSYFSVALNDDIWENVNGFTRIIIPDTFLYRNVVDFSNPFTSIVFAGIKNSIGPSFIWFITNGKWVLVSFVNAVFLFIELMYIAKTARFFSVPSNKIFSMMILIALLPSTIYHSVGALKEVPTLAFMSGFFYHYLKGERIKCILYMGLLIIFRYQIWMALSLFLLTDQFNKKSFSIAFLFIIILSAVFPFIQKFGVLYNETTELYREQNGVESSLGGGIEYIRNTIPIISAFAVIIRVIQTIYEPFFNLIRSFTFFENGNLSIINVVYFSSLLFLFRYWFAFLKHIGSLLLNPSRVSRNVMRLYLLCLVTLVPTAGFSFIQPRYLYPITSLIVLAAIVYPKNEKSSKLLPNQIIDYK